MTSEKGLPCDAVEAIIEDSEGFMWFGTQTGLCRYDGYSMLIYRRDEFDSTSISDSFVLSGRMLEDRNRRTIWIAGRYGLSAYNMSTGRFTRFAADSADPHSLSNSFVTSMCQERTGRLWIGTENGLNEMIVDSGGHVTFIRYLNGPNDSNSLGGKPIKALCEGDDGMIWVGTDHGMSRVDTKTNHLMWVFFTRRESHDQSANRVQVIRKDRNGILWVGTQGGVIRYDPRTSSFRQIGHDPRNPYSLSSNNVNSLSIEEKGILWAGTADAGLNALDTETGQCVRFSHKPTSPEGLSHNVVNDVYRDSKGSIWVSTNDGGINKYERGKRQCIHIRRETGNPRGLSSDDVWQMVEDKRGSVWIGSSEGVNVYDRRSGTFRHYHHDPFNERSLSHPHAGALHIDIDGTIWVGTHQGLNKIDPLTGSITRQYNEPLPPHNNSSNRISAVYRDSRGTLWVGTVAGPKIVNLKEKRFDPFLYYGYTTQILGDRDGRTLWVTSDGDGLVKIDLKTRHLKLFSNNPHDPTSISHNTVMSLCEDVSDPERVLWVVTFGGGLNRFDKSAGTFRRFMQPGGLADNFTSSIAFDRRGYLWLGTSKGISRFDPKTGVFRNYDTRDGINISEANQNSLLRASTGEIFVGTTKGLAIFHPDSLRDNTNVPAIVLTDFRITNKSVLPGGSGSPLTQPITETKQIVLSYRDNMITFEFAALDYVMPEKNLYAYKLEGFDNDWIHSANVRTATYTNLEPGKYIFHVRGSNNDGIWNEEGTSLSIIITPPWWKTSWAYLAYVIIIGTILYSTYRIRVHRLQLSHQLQIEHLEAEKMHEVDRMKSRFFANISHEFRTPLTLILGPIQKWKSRIGPDLQVGEEENAPTTPHGGFQPLTNTGELRHDLGMAERNAHRLLRLINQLLDLSKLEAGAMKLRASRMNIVPLIKGIAYSFESSAGMRGVVLDVRVEQEEIEVYCDRDMVEKILSNLLSNAFKFTPEGGKVEVSLQVPPSPNLPVSGTRERERGREGDLVEITVSDTGIGIPPDQFGKVFDRFYQVDASQTREHEGSGIGLALVKELVELHHGTIQVQSEVGQGTMFTVRLPLGRSHLKVDEIVEAPVSFEPAMRETEAVFAEKATEGAPEEAEPEHARGEMPIVLVVEDNADVRTYIKDYLVPVYQVAEARDGAEGIEKAEEIIPDLIISDVMMPKKDGYELSRTLKNDEKTSHIPIILLTAKAASDNKIEGLEVGADDYLIKPFEPKELLARVRNLIDLRRKLRERFRASVPLRPGEIAVTSMDDVFLNKVMAAVEQHIGDEHFHIEGLGAEVGMSRVQLHRKLTALTNQPPGEFIRYIRLHRAMELLQKGAGTVSEVGYSVGFSDPSNFSKCFHKQFGKRPSDIKKSPTAG
jgi:signal transduction histidine kinase/ligand-binding sensor domain-containing protein/DNA-binding response OmpR family regulator